jgi:hypothetical protein
MFFLLKYNNDYLLSNNYQKRLFFLKCGEYVGKQKTQLSNK